MFNRQASYRPCLLLEIKVRRGRDITLGAVHDWMDTPDPYVKLFIPTAPNGRRRTKPQSNTYNPIWEEEFQFFLDPDVNNKLDITLMESDVLTDDLVEKQTFDLSALELNKLHKQTFTFRETSKVDVEMKVEINTAPADMRYSIDLCNEETAFRVKRKKLVFDAMKGVLGERGPKNHHEVPTVAVLGSGGGFRAMVGLSGAFCALKDMGVLDCTTYTSGLSGSAWYLSTLYSHPKWPLVHPSVVRDQIRDNIHDNWMWSVLSPSWLYNHWRIIMDKKHRGQPISFTDFFGYMVGETILKDRKNIPTLSEQQGAVEDALVPLPLYTCVHVKKAVSAQSFCEWVEFSPYEIGMAKYGTFMKTEDFGCKFFCGKLVKRYREPHLQFLQGIWGSAFTILLQRVMNKGNPPEDTIKEMHNNGDLRSELQGMIDSDDFQLDGDDEDSDNEDDDDASNGEKAAEEPMEDENSGHGFLTRMLDSLMENVSVLKTRAGRAGLVHNFLRGLQLVVSPFPSEDEGLTEAVDQMALKAKRIYLVDSGLVFNSPYPMVLRPQRSADVILSFDFSAREKEDEISFQELLLAEKWAKENNLKFPPIDAEARLKKDGIKECYVFRDPTDPTCPIVLHFILVNKTFKQYSKPGVLRKTQNKKDLADFSVFEDPEGWYSTFNFHYTKDVSSRLADLTEFNTLLYEQTIKDALAESVQKQRDHVLSNGKM